jgi:hypothetical protein
MVEKSLYVNFLVHVRAKSFPALKSPDSKWWKLLILLDEVNNLEEFFDTLVGKIINDVCE